MCDDLANRAMRAQLTVYCNTETLPGNIRDTAQEELAALQKLQSDPRVKLFTSHIVGYEANNTEDPNRRNALDREHKARSPIPEDEKLLGINTMFDQYGGFTSSPMISDVQNEQIRAKLIKRGLKQRDAEHIAQAIHNNCDVFLTRDVKTIIKRHGKWIEEQYPPMKVMRPSDLVEALG